MNTLSRVGALARQHDPDRFFTTVFAPAPARPALWALIAFNHELARATERVREPMMGLIRLQWWREVVEGADKRHEVATPVRQAIAAGALREADLLGLIEAREADPPAQEADWPGFVSATSGGLAAAAAHVLGATERQAEAARAAGTAYGAAGILRNRALAGAEPVAGLSAFGQERLAAARRIPPGPALAACLVATFAARDLRRERRGEPPVHRRGTGDKLAVTFAALTGRI